ncbi:hypothetical protein GYH30_037045 [Glycine max]|nr:hypothetical protein GYH30_037045 [Glycine max]
MRPTAHWKIVLPRLIDTTAMHLQFCHFNPVDKDLGDEIVSDKMSPHMEVELRDCWMKLLLLPPSMTSSIGELKCSEKASNWWLT